MLLARDNNGNDLWQAPDLSTGTLGAGVVVIDARAIKLGQSATVQLVGGPQTDQVIVRSDLGSCSGLAVGDFRLGRGAKFELADGPEQP